MGLWGLRYMFLVALVTLQAMPASWSATGRSRGNEVGAKPLGQKQGH